MTEKNDEVVALVDHLVHTVNDPAELGNKIRDVVTAMYPVAKPIFRDGEVMLLHEFERRFKKAFCNGIEPHFHQWPVMVRVDSRHNLSVQFGKTLDAIKEELGIASADSQSEIRNPQSTL